MEEIFVPMSPGELLDKITILEIKAARIAEPAKLENVRYELGVLEQLWKTTLPGDQVLAVRLELKRVNESLWDIEDDIRDKERAKRFDEEFIRLARAVYITNDKRAALKKQVNLALGSMIVEEKSYQSYA